MKIIDIKGLCQPDPYLIEADGKYYIYCTGVDGVHCYESSRLFDGWSHVGVVCAEANRKEYWAPSVIRRNGKFYMYYSSMPQGEDDTHTQAIRVAVCDTPTGKFTFVKELLPPFSIDAHVVENSAGLWMFYSVNRYDGDKAGTYIVVDKMLDEYTLRGEPKAVVTPSLKEEIFLNDRFAVGQDWYTIEGAFYFKKDGWHYCIYSANCYFKPTYHLGYAACKSDSDELDTLTFAKHSADKFRPLLSSNAEEISTGHNSMAVADGQLYLVYHGRDANSDLSIDDRTARVCKLFAENGTLRVER